MKILRVGDPHVKPSNEDESDKLFSFIAETALDKKVDRIELLGDLNHTHSVVRLEVIEFWDHWLEHLAEIAETIAMVGNHDQSGLVCDYSSGEYPSNALSVFRRIKSKKLHIVDLPRVMGIFGYMPYVGSKERFVELANGLADSGAKVLVCHQTLVGAKYESGIYAPDGVDADLLKFDTIISGHIHSQQRFGKVIYPGTPKWDSASDANESKGIWVFEHDDISGRITKEEFISTAGVVTPIVSLVWNEGEEQPEFPENAKAAIELIGSSDWISKKKAVLKGKVSIKTKITDKKAESRKAGSSLEDFLTNVFPTAMNRQYIIEYARKIGVL